jgi:3-dehydroquinate dehydratase/shikimate dehydrogenase
VGVIGGNEQDVRKALRSLEAPSCPAPDAIELRADLFEKPQAALDTLDTVPRGLPVIFTIRLPAHGGKYEGDEPSRIRLYREAISRGAALVDTEWESPAASALAQEKAPLLVSHHDFQGMPDSRMLQRLTREMSALSPRALKLVPTAKSPADGLRMLEWVHSREAGSPHRIGFAMGETGLLSRVLSTAWGAPFTYAAMGARVAPGQTSVTELKELYRTARLDRSTRVLGVIGNPVAHSRSPQMHNHALQAHGINAVYLPIRLGEFTELEPIVDPLGLHGLSVTLPFKEDAFSFADQPDSQARSSGAANTLVIQRESDGRRTVLGYNTDFQGVLGPLRRRGIDPRGLSAGILGNGGAARGAARALKDSGAEVTIYYRNPERGRPVATALGADSAPLGDLRAGRHQLIINATPLGLKPEDPSPVPPEVFDAQTTAFDMVYDPPETPFLLAARESKSGTIPGQEMLICQGQVQFQLFTGEEATYEELEAALAR